MSHTTMRRFISLAIASLLAGAVTLGVTSPALAHDELVGTTLNTNETDGSLESFTLTFSNSIIELGTEVIATAPNGSSVIDGTPVVSGPDVTQSLKRNLTAGTYSTSWRVVSSDGHPIEGSFGIEVEADGSAKVVEGAAAEATPQDTGESKTQPSKDEQGTQEGLPTGAVVAISIGGAAALAVVVAMIIIGSRRRSQAFGASTDSDEANK